MQGEDGGSGCLKRLYDVDGGAPISIDRVCLRAPNFFFFFYRVSKCVVLKTNIGTSIRYPSRFIGALGTGPGRRASA